MRINKFCALPPALNACVSKTSFAAPVVPLLDRVCCTGCSAALSASSETDPNTFMSFDPKEPMYTTTSNNPEMEARNGLLSMSLTHYDISEIDWVCYATLCKCQLLGLFFYLFK